MNKADLDVKDFYIKISIRDLKLEIRKCERYINNQSNSFKRAQDLLDMELLKDRLNILQSIYNSRIQAETNSELFFLDGSTNSF